MASIRKKAVIIMAVCLLLVLSLGYIATQFMLMQDYRTLENQMVRENVDSILTALKDEIDNLDRYVTSYAWWDDTVNFVRTGNHQYILSNLQDTNFMQNRINAIIFTSPQDKVIYGREYQQEYGEEIPLPGEFNASLLSVSIYSYAVSLGSLLNASLQARLSGLVILPEGAMLVSIRHILPSNQTGPIQGNLLMGRYLDSLEVGNLERIAHVSLYLHRPDDPTLPKSLYTLPKGGEEEPIFIIPADTKTIDGYVVLDDITGDPILVLQLEMPRDIYNEGIATIQYIMISLALAGLMFCGVSMAILEKTIFSRMTRLERDVGHIGKEGRFSARLPMKGSDELTKLAKSINEMLASLQESQKRLAEVKSLAAIGEAAAMVGHDLRNPLQSTTMTLYLAKRLLASGDVSNTSEAVQLLDGLDKQVHYMDKIVSDLQDYSRPVAGELVEIDLRELIQKVLSDVKIPSTVELRRVFQDGVSKVLAEPTLLERILVNLVLNAIQAMPNGGKLTVSTTRNEEFLAIAVQDTGVGIPAENLEKVFKPFYTTKAQGQGLGLAVCRRLIEAQGGTITLKSIVGRGSTFTVTLPVGNAATVISPLIKK